MRGRSGSTLLAAVVAIATLLAAPFPALAHGLSGRADLPMPTWLFAWVGAVVLVVSFLALGVLWRSAILERSPERRLLAVPRWAEVVAGAVGIAAFVAVVWAGLAGTQTPNENLAAVAIYVPFWLGFTFLSALLGDVFRALNPWRALARALAWAARPAGIVPARPPLRYPERLGHWPAVAGIGVFAWVELVAHDGDVPQVLATLSLAYAGTQLVGMALFGIETWTRQADPFAVYFGLIARIAPLAVADGFLVLRRPLSGLARMRPAAGTVALLCVMIGATIFDGAENSALWLDAGLELVSIGDRLGLSEARALELAGTVGLLASISLVGAIYWAGIAGMRRAGGPQPALGARFVHTLVPIAVGYAAAHYFSLLVFQGQSLPALASDPLGDGSNYLGTASVGIDYAILSATVIWYVQAAALVAGHVGGLALAHDRALSTWTRPEVAIRSQYWMLAVMVGFTSLGLWLLSAVSTG